ncbi:glycosyltransferase family 9 protein [Rhodocytophaga aerolata]
MPKFLRKLFRNILDLRADIIKHILFVSIHLTSNQRKIEKGKNLLIVRLDGIGDYILFRNFIEEIRKNFPQYHITLLCRGMYKDLAQALDSQYIDEFIWFDRMFFFGNFRCLYATIKQIRKKHYELVFSPRYTRRKHDVGDFFVKMSSATEKIGISGISIDYAQKFAKHHYKYYTRIVEVEEKPLFEFYRNKEFFEKAFHKPLSISNPHIDVSSVSYSERLPDNFVILFPGASAAFRQWPTDKFATLATYIQTRYDLWILIAGSKADYFLAEKIIHHLKKVDTVINLCGKTTLIEFAYVLSKAKLLISNETSAPHIAAAVHTPTICISNGNHLGRFNPYPAQIFKEHITIYPPQIARSKATFDDLVSQYHDGSSLDINSISPADIIPSIDLLLTKHTDYTSIS